MPFLKLSNQPGTVMIIIMKYILQIQIILPAGLTIVPMEIVLSTTSYYTEQNLSPVIRAKVSGKYPGKKIFGVTEVSNNENVTYHIVLEDDKYWYNIKSDATGLIKLEKKLKRQINKFENSGKKQFVKKFFYKLPFWYSRR